MDSFSLLIHLTREHDFTTRNPWDINPNPQTVMSTPKKVLFSLVTFYKGKVFTKDAVMIS